METYTIPEAAEISGLSPKQVRLALEGGQLRAVRTGGRWRIPRYELERAGMLEGPQDPAPPSPSGLGAVARPQTVAGEAERPPNDDEVARLSERLAELERRLDELEGVAHRTDRESSMRAALTPLFSEGELAPEPPRGPRFRSSR